ncbi:MAG: hypothetical protein HY913_23050 [Desulfomonile tiedjei]|nr:hypothetical protein [Desulfomonile tiedjei]
MKALLHLLIGVIILLTQSEVVMIVELPSADLSRTQPGVAVARTADLKLDSNAVNLSEIRALLSGVMPAQPQMPRISPISVPFPKRGPVK